MGTGANKAVTLKSVVTFRSVRVGWPLVEALEWAAQREIFLPLEELFPDPEQAAATLHEDPFAFAKMQIMKQAEHMRKHPVFIELCLAELSGSGPVVDAL